MIDTIVLRIHNLSKYVRTCKALTTIKKDASQKIIVHETGEVIDDNFVAKMVYLDTANNLVLNHRSTYRVPSSHYTLSYLVSNEEDYLEFNFSIPKYIWGTNLFQFIDYYDQSPDKCFNKLLKFLELFFKSSFFLDKINYDDVEINRLDLCYNQFFPTSSDLMQYFIFQCQKLKRFTFKHKEKIHVYGDEALDIVTQRYSFKIYNKGAEFRKHDRKQLEKSNPKGYDIEKLQGCADRILRYEVTFRNMMFNYFFQQMYFFDTKVAKKCHYRYLYKSLRLDGGERKTIKTKYFFVESMYDHFDEYKRRFPNDWFLQLKGDNNVTFDFTMFKCCYNFFWQYVKKFQINNSVSLSEMEKKIGILAKEIETKNMVRSVKNPEKNLNRLLLYAVWSQTVPLSELRRKGLISQRTYWRILKDFKKVGLDEFNPDQRTVKVGLDYQDYKYFFGNLHQHNFV